MREQFWTGVGCVGLVIACSSNANSPSDAGLAGSSANGGAASHAGGAASGGAASHAGGAASGGAASHAGGAASGGAASHAGGAASGGAASHAGGAASGGAASHAGGAASGGTAGASTASCTGSTAGYKVIWSDEFNGPTGTAVDSSKWAFDVGGTGWGNNELEYYTNGTNNAAMDGSGNLLITAKQESMGGKSYTSARIKTQGLKSFTYGRIEARMKIAQGNGLWPAFWMLGEDIADNPWPACGEIDIMENIGKEPNIIHGTIHGPGYSAGAGPTKQHMFSAAVASAFHVFAVEWELNAIRWYVDDILYSTKTPSDIPSGATWVFGHPFFIIMNLAVGGGFPGNPDGTASFPQQLQVDYVRVCQK